MPVTRVAHDTDALTLVIHAEFTAPMRRVWEIYADPRKLEQVWGPPSYPATVVDHDFSEGGRVNYFMTGPDGQKYFGYWAITQIEEPFLLCFDDGFADSDFNADPELPVSKNEYRFEEVDGRTRATYTSTYASREGLEQVLAMGVVEGATSAINQIDALVST